MREEDNAASRSAPAAGESPVETGDQGVAQQQQQQQLEEEPSFDKTSAAPTLEVKEEHYPDSSNGRCANAPSKSKALR